MLQYSESSSIKIAMKNWDVVKCYFKLTDAFEKTENERFE